MSAEINYLGPTRSLPPCSVCGGEIPDAVSNHEIIEDPNGLFGRLEPGTWRISSGALAHPVYVTIPTKGSRAARRGVRGVVPTCPGRCGDVFEDKIAGTLEREMMLIVARQRMRN